MRRARDTAELAGLGDRAEVDPDLHERDYGEYEGLTTKEIRKTIPGWDVWRDEVPGGETLAAVGARVDRAIARALAADGDSSSSPTATCCASSAARWIGIGPEGGGHLVVATAALCTLGFERERRVIKGWNS